MLISLDDAVAALPQVEHRIAQYAQIINSLYHEDVSTSTSFQILYNAFYKMRQRPQAWYIDYFSYMERQKNNSPNFFEVLSHFYANHHRYEPSFSSKLVATTSPDMPVWDSHVLAHLHIKKPSYAFQKNLPAEDALKLYNDLYGRIIEWYHNYLQSEECKQILQVFNSFYPQYDFTDMKKIDLALWSIGKAKKTENI